jgi:exodeoxyribonuclease-3
LQLLSYNLLKHKAVKELDGLAVKYKPDVLCLQEVDVPKLPQELGNLRLAVGTEKNRLGLAVYLDSSKYEVEDVGSFSLRNSHYDRIAAPAHERLLGVRAHQISTGQKFTVGSFHASPLTALNALRRHQIQDGLQRLETLGENSPLMMLGDFNYPIFKARLAREVKANGFELYTSDQQTYRHFLGAVSGYFDFAAGKDFSINWMKTLKQGVSDHLPILMKAEATYAPTL